VNNTECIAKSNAGTLIPGTGCKPTCSDGYEPGGFDMSLKTIQINQQSLPKQPATIDLTCLRRGIRRPKDAAVVSRILPNSEQTGKGHFRLKTFKS